MEYNLFVGWFLFLMTILVVSWTYSAFYRPVVIQRFTYGLFAIRDQNRRRRIQGEISDEEFALIEDRANVAIKIVEFIDVAMILTIYRRLKRAGELDSKVASKDVPATRYVAEMSDRLSFLTLQAAIHNSHGIGLIFTILRKINYVKTRITKTSWASNLRVMNDGVLSHTPLSVAERINQQMGLTGHFHSAA